MRITRYKTSVGAGTFLFIIPYILFLGRVAIGNTTFAEFFSIYGISLVAVFFIGLACIGLKIFFVDKYSLKTIILLMIIFVLFFVSYKNSTYVDIIILLLLFIASKNIKLDTIVRCHFFVYLTILVLAMGCALMGIIDNYAIYSNLRGYRYSLGNIYPTDFAAGTLYLMMDFVYLKRDKWKIIYSVGLIVIAYAVYRVTDANTSFILSLFVSLATALNQTRVGKRIFESAIFNRVTRLAFPVLAVVSIYIQYAYTTLNSSFFSIANLLLNNRIVYGNRAINEYGLSLFGTRVNMIGSGWGTNTSETYFYVDNGYLQLALTFGLMALIIICIGFMLVCYKRLSNKSTDLGVFMIVMFTIAVSAVIEPRFYNILYNAFLLDLGIEFFNFRKRKVTTRGVE